MQSWADHAENQRVNERQSHMLFTTHYFSGLGQGLQYWNKLFHQLPLWRFHGEGFLDAWFCDRFIRKHRLHCNSLLEKSLEHDDSGVPPDRAVILEFVGSHAKLFLPSLQGAGCHGGCFFKWVCIALSIVLLLYLSTDLHILQVTVLLVYYIFDEIFPHTWRTAASLLHRPTSLLTCCFLWGINVVLAKSTSHAKCYCSS